MGCVVNGPGEAKVADIGIAGGKGRVVLFKKGKTIGTYPQEEAVSRLISEIRRMTDNNEVAVIIPAYKREKYRLGFISGNTNSEITELL